MDNTPSRRQLVAITVSLLLLATPAPTHAGGDRRAQGSPEYELLARLFGLRGDKLEITSPDTAQTYVDGNTTRYVLLWDERQGQLFVAVTFSNSPFIGFNRVRQEENFNFRLPGVTRDPATGVFSVRDARGRTIPVAAPQRGGLASGNIRPTPGTTIRVAKPDGLVNVRVTATPGSSPLVRADRQGRWVIDGVDSPL